MPHTDPNQGPRAELIEAAQGALDRGAWRVARDAFERLLRSQEGAKSSSRAPLDLEASAETLAGLAEALWWLGEVRGALDRWEEAYSGFRRGPDATRAAFVAIQLAILYNANMGNKSAAAGWAARAARLIEDQGLVPLWGWVLIARATISDDPEHQEAMAREAQRLGRDSGDRDMELCALTQLGVALVDQGEVAQGTALHDEAMAGALAGEGQLDTVVFASCEMMASYSRCAQYERMVQWIHAADRFVERYGCPYLNASCRTHYGEVLFATGDWGRAAEELRAAVRLSESSLPAVRAKAVARLAELRLEQGHHEEAERLVSEFDGHNASAVVRTRLHLLAGRFGPAATTARSWLRVVGEKRLESAPLVELLGEAEIGEGSSRSAVEKGHELADRGKALGCLVMRARGERLLGRALMATSDPTAREHLDGALAAFIRLEMPFEVARTRVLIARSVLEAEPGVAEAETRAALTVFERLGASTARDVAGRLLREIDARVRARASASGSPSGLTRRELEVLRLVAQGLSDKEIAARLVLSRHTVHRHVHSILRKLDLPSRAGAATHAATHGLL